MIEFASIIGKSFCVKLVGMREEKQVFSLSPAQSALLLLPMLQPAAPAALAPAAAAVCNTGDWRLGICFAA